MNNKIPPIPMMLHIIGNIPTSYAMAMSYEEQLLCLKNYLCEEVVPKMNENIEEIQTLITYINNYFDNLDVQEEIDNKIDEMVESGELQEIITSYLQVNGVLAFNTLNDMINSTNIIDGTTCRTLGLNTYNDGKGQLYKIREITNQDVVDNVNIISIPSSQTLVAELISNYYINNLQSQINTINSDIDTINNRIDNLKNRKFLFIGDSYGTDRPEQWGTGWITYVIQYLGLTLNNDAFVSAEGACGFLGDPAQENKTFLRKLQEAYNSISEPNEITDIIIGGGINDNSYTIPQINSAISTFMTNAKTMFPNAKVSLGMISWTKNVTYINQLVLITMAYKGITSFGGNYIENSEYCWHYNSWLYDTVHPLIGGQTSIANCIINYIKCGTGLSAYGQYLEATVSAESPFSWQYGHLKTEQKGNIIDGVINGTISHTGYSYTFNGTWVKFATFTGAWLVGGGRTTIPTKCLVVDTSNVVHTFILDLKFDSNGIYFRGIEKSNESTTDLSLTIKTIIILETAFTLPAVGN